METDKLNRYRNILRTVFAEYSEWSTGDGVIAEMIEDPKRDHFEVIRFGWDKSRRIHGTILHADIINGKIWIQYDSTNRPLAEELVAAGVPKDEIVLGYKSERIWPYTGCGIG